MEVGMTIPILDWGKRRGKVKVAESNRDVTLSKIRQEEISFNQDIFLLVENFNNQAAQLEIAQEADVIAEKRYKTSIETFMIGKINILDLTMRNNLRMRLNRSISRNCTTIGTTITIYAVSLFMISLMTRLLMRNLRRS